MRSRDLTTIQIVCLAASCYSLCSIAKVGNKVWPCFQASIGKLHFIWAIMYSCVTEFDKTRLRRTKLR